MQTAVLAKPTLLLCSNRCSLARIAANRAVKLCRLMLACSFGLSLLWCPSQTKARPLLRLLHLRFGEVPTDFRPAAVAARVTATPNRVCRS